MVKEYLYAWNTKIWIMDRSRFALLPSRERIQERVMNADAPSLCLSPTRGERT